MLTVDETLQQLLVRAIPVTETVELPLLEAGERVLADSIVAPVAVPPADNSAMDGYTFAWQDAVDNQWTLPVSARITAGMAPGTLQPGSAARIFTGAEIPDGADTVAMQEDCRRQGDWIEIDPGVARRDNVRPRGQDISKGAAVVNAGTVLRPQHLGLLASVGQETVSVCRPLTVAIVCTGNELRDPGQPLARGQIYNSNRFQLIGLCQRWGCIPLDMGIVPDRPDALEACLSDAARRADVVVTTGGVSVGEEDYVKTVIEKLGTIEFWKIAVKPGKPLTFGNISGTPVLGLPGNPASALVIGLIFLRPFLLAMAGRADYLPEIRKVRSTFHRKAGKRQEYLRVRVKDDNAELYPNQSSGVLMSACWGNGLAIQPVGKEV